jgi:hypothetical protein
MRFPFLWTLVTKSESQSLQNFNTIMLIHCLTFGDIFIMDHPFYGKKKKTKKKAQV